MSNKNNSSIYILQIDGKDLIDKEYNVKSFKKYKVAFDYSIDLIKIHKLQKELLPNEKNFFKNKNNKTDRKIYSDLLVSVTFKYKTAEYNTAQIREMLYKNGFNIDGKHYVRFKRSSGSSRLGKCLFIREELYDEMMEYSYMSLNFSEEQEVDLASLEAYISLTTSSIIDTIKIKPNEILVIPDYISEFDEKGIVTSIENGKLVTTEKLATIQNSIFDGQSMLDVSVFQENGYGDKGMLLLRNRFFKSCCFNTNIQQFFTDRNITQIKQLNGFTLAKKVQNIKLITTESSIKYLKFGTLEDYFDKIEKIFGVVKYDKEPHFFDGNLVQTHYQLLNTLEFTKDEMYELLQNTLNYIKLLKNNPCVMRYFLKMNLPNIKNQDEKYYNLETTNNFVYTMLGINDDITKTNLYTKFLSNIISSIIDKTNNGHILVNGNYSTLFGNAMEMLEHSINNFNGQSILDKDEIISKRFESGAELLGIRSPHITIGNIWLIKNTNKPIIDRYFNLTKQIVIINAIGNNVLDRLNGCDFDSDTILLTDDKMLINKAKQNYDKFLVPISQVQSQKTVRYNNYTHKADLDTKTSVNKIGEIVNLSQILNSKLWECKKNGHSYDEIYKDICKLAICSCIEIDKSKKEFDINMSEEIKELRGKYQENVEQRPMFFHKLHIPNSYKKDVSKYRYYDTSMDFLVAIMKNANKIAKKDYANDKIELYELFHHYEQQNVNYRQIAKINELIMEYKHQGNSLWANENLSNSDKFLQYLEMKNKLLEKITKIKLNETTICEIIKQTKNSQKRLLIGILFKTHRNLFNKMIKRKAKPISNIKISENGIIDIYNLKFDYTK